MASAERSSTIPPELVRYLCDTTGLARSRVVRLIEDILGAYDETVEAYVIRRHRELQHEGHANSEIFARLASEVRETRFRGPTLSERQVRRLIYG